MIPGEDKSRQIAFPAREVNIRVSHPTAGDRFFTKMIHAAWAEYIAAFPDGEQGCESFTASNGVEITCSWPERL